MWSGFAPIFIVATATDIALYSFPHLVNTAVHRLQSLDFNMESFRHAIGCGFRDAVKDLAFFAGGENSDSASVCQVGFSEHE